MKKILLSFVLLLSLAATAQNRQAISGQVFRFGVKGVYNSTWMFNNNISDRGDDVNYKSAFGSSFGLTGAYNFTDESGIVVDLLFATHHAKYEPKDKSSLLDLKLSYTDLPILFRLGPPDGGGYVEIGPMISFLSGAKETSNAAPFDYSEKDVKKDFNGTIFSGILGFGYDFQVGQNLLISAGLRFGYGFSDATKKYDSEAEFTANAESLTSLLAHQDSNGDFNYASSHRVFGGLNIGILYRP